MNETVKFTYIIPPHNSGYFTPIPGIPTLLGILKANNIDVEFINMNLEIKKFLFTEVGISKILEFYDNLKPSEGNSEYINDIIKQSVKDFEKNKKLITNSKKTIVFAKHVLTNSKLYYDPILYEAAKSMSIIVNGEFYNPFSLLCKKLLFDFYTENHLKLDKTYTINIEEMKQHFDSFINPTKEFVKETVEKIKNSGTKGVGISINLPEQLFSGLHLAYLLKKETNIHINIGGCFFECFYKEITNLKELFGTYFDSISISDNTCTCTDLIKYLDGEMELNESANIIYVENNEIKVNRSEKKIPFIDLPVQSFGNYTKEDYLLPELILPIKTSVSCYWGKCIFCECSASDTKYEVKPVERVVEEIEYLSAKYKTKYFCFWDNAIHPQYAKRLSELLIKKKLNIKYSIYARLEDEFDYKTLKKLKKSGCLIIHYGLDSASEKILKYINKGITLNIAEKVIKNTHKAGINNFVYLILGHPTETVEDLENDIAFVKKLNNKISFLYVIPQVFFRGTSIINKDINKYKKLITIPDEVINETNDKLKQIFGVFKTTFNGHDYNILYSAKFGQKFPNPASKNFKSKLKHINKLYMEFQKRNNNNTD